MKVTEFFIGMGPRIWSFRRGEVEYGIKAIPAVAYVRIVGMTNLDEVDPVDEPRTYRQKPYRQRMLVAVAGSGMHFLLAIVLSLLLFTVWGRRDATVWEIDEPLAGSAAANAGLVAGDRILAVDGVEVDTHAEMASEVRRRPGQEVDLVIARDGEEIVVPARLGARALVIGTIGEDMSLSSYDGVVTVNTVLDGSVQAEAGLRDGDEIRAINGVELDGLDDLEAAVAAAQAGTLELDIERGGEPGSVTVDLGRSVDVVEPTGFLGVGHDEPLQRLGLVAAAGETASLFGQTAKDSAIGIAKLFNPVNLAGVGQRVVEGDTDQQPSEPTTAAKTEAEYRQSQENRPISIIGVVGLGSQTESLESFIAFLAAINIVIGVINLIPLLPFDGGHVAVATYEKIRELFRHDGKRYFADANKLMPVAVGVIVLMVAVSILGASLDILDPIKI
jgi:RIP metalloprotease RseP